jgi:hypothetical protein
MSIESPIKPLERKDDALKETNPKDAIGVRKWRQFFTVPARVMWEVGVGMMEGAAKYGRHNYRVSGVCASVYTDAALGHIQCWVEGEDTDADSGLSHITKAICSLIVLRDGMLEGNFTDDRPPRHDGIDEHRAFLQARVEEILERYPNHVSPYTQAEHGQELATAPKTDEATRTAQPARGDTAWY